MKYSVCNLLKLGQNKLNCVFTTPQTTYLNKGEEAEKFETLAQEASPRVRRGSSRSWSHRLADDEVASSEGHMPQRLAAAARGRSY